MWYNIHQPTNKGMSKPTGIDWKQATVVVGHREDVTPDAWKEQAFTRQCANCHAKTYLETEYPTDVPILCNLCAAQYATIVEQDPGSLLMYDMPTDLKARLIDIAQERRLPIEDVCKEFLNWKLGKRIYPRLYCKPGTDKKA